LRACGSAVTQRCEDLVSGMMMPTLAPLPSSAPPLAELLPAEEDELTADVAGAGAEVESLEDFLLEEHALSTSDAATPTMTIPSALLRMDCPAFHRVEPTWRVARSAWGMLLSSTYPRR
jgi:hypothetical protein